MSLRQERRNDVLRLRFVGARPDPAVEGRSPLAGKVNYLLGNDPATWRTGVPTYRQIVYRRLWSGIDLAFRGDGHALKYEFRVAAGADPSAIRLAYRGARDLSLDRNGRLVIHTRGGALRDARPISYQEIGGRRSAVASRFVLADQGYGFALGRYDRGRRVGAVRVVAGQLHGRRPSDRRGFTAESPAKVVAVTAGRTRCR